ncbi:MAG TPA: DUF6647 family protein [Azospirillum sp.]|nr:DUF6647 family protein [Azospirillum sp.]
MGELVAALLLWIGAHTDYRVAGIPLPEVRVLSARELTREYYEDAPSTYTRPVVDDRVLALYDPTHAPNGIIFLRDDLPPHDVLFQERLLHELVHHVQTMNGMNRRYRCPAQGEREAYRLGGLFLKESGVRDPLRDREFWAGVYSRC